MANVDKLLNEEKKNIILDAVDLFGFIELRYLPELFIIMYDTAKYADKVGNDAVKWLFNKMPEYKWTYTSRDVIRGNSDLVNKMVHVLSGSRWIG